MKCGIDLGTTFSAISWYDEMNKRIVSMELNVEDGHRILRSVVFYQKDGKEPIVGRIALNAKKQYPEQVIVGAKRSMGRDWAFEPGDGSKYTPAQVSAEILKTLLEDAEDYLGEKVDEIVVTVPAYFAEAQRNDTLEAAVLAGIPRENVTLQDEPQAAALAYCVDNESEIDDDYFLVYDLGGGTFDVVLIHAQKKSDGDGEGLQVDTLYKAGNAQLGGLQWDEKLADIVAERIKEEHGIDPRDDPQDEALLMENVEQGKLTLSRMSPVMILGDRHLHQAEVTVTDFEDATAALLFETRQLLEEVLDEAESSMQIPKDRVEVLLTGGSTRMPQVGRMIEEVTGKKPLMHGNPDLLVSRGAAYWAYAGDTRFKRTNITHYAVGIECTRLEEQGDQEWFNSVMLPKGSRIGSDSDVEREFFKAKDGMEEVQIVLYKSPDDTEDLEECTQMARFVIGPLPAGGQRGERIRVKLGHSDDGILHGEAEDVTTGQKVAIHVERDRLA